MLSFTMALMAGAQTCREVVRDSSGRIVQTIEKRQGSGGSVQSNTRDASGRVTGNSTSNPSCRKPAKVPIPPPGIRK